MEDRELIRQILNNDYRAMEELHRRYVDRIFNYIYHQTNDYHDAEELLQDVFFKTAKRLHQFEGKSSFKTWIFKIARNVVIDYYRKNKDKRKNTTIEENSIESLGEAASVEHTVLQNLHMMEVMRAIDKLPEHYQMVLHLRFIEDFTLQETADAMGKTVLSVKAMQLRARRALSEQINMEVAVDD
ncbi:RNA polymerase sigma factor [Oceanobacillus arenosus]|uniref:RNA polymerase sigma factor n=1 Tax=Oceanobacillus arenosus TaxID=1229153 RepID=A0A3D8PXM7_9BACI|nr:RNA polymerase sigma factor [Oceanobacillus arenosus]RDW20071.1 RNA polymerase sigma factor [Oceanobacillus arenosus]